MFQPDIFMDGKTCTKCLQWKHVDDFYPHPVGRLGRETRCKVCRIVDGAESRSRPEAKAKKAARDREKNRDPLVRARNNELRKSPQRLEKRRKWRRDKLKNDPHYALAERSRGMVHRTLRAFGLQKNLPTFEMLGYGPEKLRARIECQFKPGMSWENHSEWHIDHKKPITAFLSQGKSDPKLINALCNLQPLWGSENMSKNNKWPYLANNNTPAKEAA